MKKWCCILFGISLFVSCNAQQDYKTITTIELKELLQKEKIQLVDVRTPKEIALGSIESAIFINYFDEDFTEKASKQLDKSKPVYLYCRSGNRSGKASKLLKDKGFDVTNVLGGYKQWKKEN